MQSVKCRNKIRVKLVVIVSAFFIATTAFSQEYGSNMEALSIETSKGNIEYTDQGAGKAIVIIHGGNDNCFTNIRQEHLVINGYRVVVPSRPGYGHTSLNFGKTAQQQADFCQTLAGFIEDQQSCSYCQFGRRCSGP